MMRMNRWGRSGVLLCIGLLACGKTPEADTTTQEPSADDSPADTDITAPADTDDTDDSTPEADPALPIAGHCFGPLEDSPPCRAGMCPTYTEAFQSGRYLEFVCGTHFGLRTNNGQLVDNHMAVFTRDGRLVSVYEYTDYTPHCDGQSFDIFYGEMPPDCP